MGDDEKFKVNVNVGGSSNTDGSSSVLGGSQDVIKPTTPAQPSVNPIAGPIAQPGTNLGANNVSPSSVPGSSFGGSVNPSDTSGSSPVVQPSQTVGPAPGVVSTSSASTNQPVVSPPSNTFGSSGPVANSASMPPSGNGMSSKKGSAGKKKVLLISLIAGLFILGGSASAYFGYVVPNNPTNVWSKAMSNTSKGYDKLVEYQEGNKDKTTTKIDGTYNIAFGEMSADGSYSSEADQKNSKSRFDVGFMGNRINVDMLTEIKDSSTYPDVYFKAEGIKAFAPMIGGSSPELTALINESDNQWYVIDRSLFSQALAGSEAEQAQSNQLTQEDVDALTQAIGEVSKQYIFTTDESMAVLNANEFIGKEEIDGRQQFHYKVGVNKANLKTYASELAKKLESTEAYKKLTGGSEPIDLTGINTSIDGIDDNYKADVWVDAGTKLIRTVRFTSKDNDKNYLDLGLKYDGGSKFPFYAKIVGSDESGSGEINFQVTLDTSNDNLDIDMNAKIEGDSPGEMSLTGKAVFSNEAVQLDNKPTNAKSFMELMGFAAPIGPQPNSPNASFELGSANGVGSEPSSYLLGASTQSANNQIVDGLYANLMNALNQSLR